MQRALTTLIALVILALGVAPAVAQLKPETLAKRAEIEERLKNARIVDYRQLPDSQAVTEPWLLVFEDEQGRFKGLWKNVRGRYQGYLEGWQYEVAAYELDKLLGLDMVPPTVARRFQSKIGSCQFWIDGTQTGKKMQDEQVMIPPEAIERFGRRLALQEAFDNLIGNEDRILRNSLYTEDFRMILIDHSRAFRRTKRFRKNLVFPQPTAMAILPRSFIASLRTLDAEAIAAAVGEHLNEKEIDAILERRDLILEEVERRIKKKGEEAVLYGN